jgi:hypothetical protein
MDWLRNEASVRLFATIFGSLKLDDAAQDPTGKY